MPCTWIAVSGLPAACASQRSDSQSQEVGDSRHRYSARAFAGARARSASSPTAISRTRTRSTCRRGRGSWRSDAGRERSAGRSPSWPRTRACSASIPRRFFLARARELAAGIENLSFAEGDARSLALDERSFDAVVFHTSLCHVPRPELALALVAFARRTACSFRIAGSSSSTATTRRRRSPSASSTTPDMCRGRDRRARPRPLADPAPAGAPPRGRFAVAAVESYGFVEIDEPEYMLTLVGRGVDALLVAAASGPTRPLHSEPRHAGAPTPASSSATSPTRPSSTPTRRCLRDAI